MSPAIATLAYVIGILGLFLLDFDPDAPPSKALWLPLIWLSIEASRPVSQWVQGSQQSSAQAYLEGSPLDRNLFLILSVLGLMVLARRSGELKLLLRTNRMILLFFLYCGVSVLWSDFSGVAFRRWIKALGEFVMILVVLTDPHPIVAIKRLFSRAGFVLLPLSVLFIKYYGDLGRDYRPGDFGGGWSTVYLGVTTDKNALGMISMIFGGVALWQFLQLWQSKEAPRRSKRMLAQGTLLVFACWLLWNANSMTSLVCFIAAAALLIPTTVWPLFRRREVLVACVAALLGFAVITLFIAPNLVSVVGRDPTLTGRTEIWNHVLDLAGNPIVGTGFESFWLGPRLQQMWNLYWWRPNEAHNGYIEVFLDLGWIGVALFGFVVLTGLRKIIAAVDQQSEAAAFIALFVAALIYNLTESGVRELNPMWFVFLLSIMAVTHASLTTETVYVDALGDTERELHELAEASSNGGI